MATAIDGWDGDEFEDSSDEGEGDEAESPQMALSYGLLATRGHKLPDSFIKGIDSLSFNFEGLNPVMNQLAGMYSIPPMLGMLESPALKKSLDSVLDLARTAGGFDALSKSINSSLAGLGTIPAVGTWSNDLVAQIEAQTAGIWETIRGLTPEILGAWKRYPHLYLPDNLWPRREAFDADRMLQLALEEGVAFAGGLHSDVAVKLHDATDVRAVLGREFRTILDYAKLRVQRLENPRWHRHRVLLNRAIDAAEQGHIEAAQTLASTSLDAALTAYIPDGDSRRELLDRNANSTGTPIESYSTIDAFVWLPVWHSYTHWRPNRDPAPVAYSRHATAHSVSGRQFSKRNAAAVVLIVTSLLIHLEHTPHKVMPNDMLPEPKSRKKRSGNRGRGQSKPGDT